MPYINPQARLCFLAHPRAASHSISRALQEQAGFRSDAKHHGTRASIVRRHPEADNWTFFCVVRNPYDALVSWWYHRGKNDGHEFNPRWIERLEREVGVERPPGNPVLVEPGRLWIYADDSDAIVRYEQLDADLNELLEAHDLPAVVLPYDVVSRRERSYAEHYDSVTRDWVTDRYGEELRIWGYGWQEPAMR